LSTLTTSDERRVGDSRQITSASCLMPYAYNDEGPRLWRDKGVIINEFQLQSYQKINGKPGEVGTSNHFSQPD
jgi:hypothetical protein